MEPTQTTAWPPLEIPADFSVEGRKAPLLVPVETGASYRRALVALFEGTGASINAVEAGLSTAAALIEGAQGFLSIANDLTRPTATLNDMRRLAEDLLRTVGALLKQRRSAYAIHQMAGVLASRLPLEDRSATLPRLPRLRDFMSPLELTLERIGAGRQMEAAKLGTLCVHLDEFYDDCALLLARFFHLLALERAKARAVAPDFLRRLYTDFAHASFADHLLAEHDAQPEEKEEPDDPFASPGRGKEPSGSGLLGLLPTLTQALASLGA